MKFLLLGFLALFSFAESIAKPEKISDLIEWKGKMPFDDIGGITLWGVAQFKKELTILIGEREYKRLTEYSGPSSEVATYKNFLFADTCQKHNCAGERFDLIVDIEKKIVFVCQMRGANSNKKARWFASSKKPFESNVTCGTEKNIGEHNDKYFEERISLIPKKIREP